MQADKIFDQEKFLILALKTIHMNKKPVGVEPTGL
jgi:hypothetical protein